MLKNYILIAFRQFSRHKMFSALNVFCLAIGISFCLLIVEYVLHENSVNTSLKNDRQQYFLTSHWKVKDTGPEITTVGPLAKTLRQRHPELVANYYRFNPVTTSVSAGDKHFKENVSIGDTSIVSMYGLSLLYGDPAHAFINNRSTIITEELAMKLFGEKNVINKTVTLSNLTATTQDYKVSAVLKTLPYNTVINLLDKKGYGMYIPFEGNNYYPGGSGEENWTGFNTVGFVELQPGITPGQLIAPVRNLLKLNSPDNINKNLDVQFRPLSSYYLDANNAAVSKTLSILSLVALGILVLAIINFVNITIGTSSYRIKEIGLRKVFGSRRSQLVHQYLIESVILTIFAGLLSVVLYGIFRPAFNQILNTNLNPINGFHLKELATLSVIVLVSGLLAGIYPAIILSGSQMVNSVKGKLGSVEKGLWLKKSLLILQFTIAIVVFIFSMTISKQVRYFFSKDLGYDKEQLMVVTAFPKQWDSAGVNKIESIRNSMSGIAAVKDATVSFDIPERGTVNQFEVNPEGPKNNQTITVQSIAVDEEYASTFGLNLVEGRFFNQGGVFVPGEVVINQSAEKSFGWSNATGRTFRMPSIGVDVKVVGVVKDFNLGTLHESIVPLVLFHVKTTLVYRYLTIKLRAGNLADAIALVRAKWKDVSPNTPFEYFFMDEKLQSMYQAELQLKKAANIATGLMLLIVMLGIFGVLSLALTKRMKEIAVRKVLGAEIHHILGLFVRQYAGLMLIATMIAWPLSYYFSNQWLQQYVYRIPQAAGVYFIAAVFVAVIALVLISLQCLKVALANPVTSLRSE